MGDNLLKLVKIFLGSPGGLTDERSAAKRIVDEINRSHSEHWGCQLQLVGWEATLPGYSRAQSLINQDLDKCSYFVGVIWNHWGSKPDDGDSRYSSGFQEEFERAKERVSQGLMKDIALYFKEIPTVQLADPGPSVALVVKFRDDCIERRKPLFRDFSNLLEFETLLRAKLEEIGWQEAVLSNLALPGGVEAETPAPNEEQRPIAVAPTDRLISEPSARFISELLGRPAEWDLTLPEEVARLRLVGAAISRPGNDETYLGNHDANLLFARSRGASFSDSELRMLIDTGVVGFRTQNVPLWHWVAAAGDAGLARLDVLAAFGNAQEVGNAIRVLHCLGRSVPNLAAPFTQSVIVKRWLTGNQASVSLEPAIDLLRDIGTPENIAFAETLLEEIAPPDRDKVAAMIVIATLRIGLDAAFEKLHELDPDPPGESLARGLFETPESITTEQLIQSTSRRSDAVRRRAVALLADRDSVDRELAERLLGDRDREVRLLALEALIRDGKRLEDDEAQRVLAKPASSNALSGLFAPSGSEDNSYFERYREARLSEKPFEALKQLSDAGGVFDYLETIALYRAYHRRAESDLHANLDDGFRAYFEKRLADMSSRYGADSKLVRDTTGLSDFIRKRLVSAALDVVCLHGDRSALQRVRRVLDREDIYYSEIVLRFLGRFGNWSDRDRILKFQRRSPNGHLGSILSIPSQRTELPIAQALYKLGRTRLADLLGLETNASVKRAILATLTRGDISRLSDDLLLAQFGAKDDDLRQVLALQCCLSLPKRRIGHLLDEYLERESRFYNVIHWLDLAASMTRATARHAASVQLALEG